MPSHVIRTANCESEGSSCGRQHRGARGIRCGKVEYCSSHPTPPTWRSRYSARNPKSQTPLSDPSTSIWTPSPWVSSSRCNQREGFMSSTRGWGFWERERERVLFLQGFEGERGLHSMCVSIFWCTSNLNLIMSNCSLFPNNFFWKKIAKSLEIHHFL